MEGLKLSFIFLALFGFVCLSNGDTFLGLQPKSSNDDKAATTATTTSEPGSACGGLKGFLHICDKTGSAEKVQKRSPSDDDSSDESDDSDDEKSSSEEGVVKRQAEDPEAPEEPPMVDSALPQPEDATADLMAPNKRQTDDSNSSEETEEDKKR